MERHARWRAADDGLLTSVGQTKQALVAAIEGLDESGSFCDSVKMRIEECKQGNQPAAPLLDAFEGMISELVEKISSLHAQIASTRVFIAREVVAHHDQIAIGLSESELRTIDELNAFRV
jgi:hypothetical protein